MPCVELRWNGTILEYRALMVIEGNLSENWSEWQPVEYED